MLFKGLHISLPYLFQIVRDSAQSRVPSVTTCVAIRGVSRLYKQIPERRLRRCPDSASHSAQSHPLARHPLPDPPMMVAKCCRLRVIGCGSVNRRPDLDFQRFNNAPAAL